MYDPVRAHREHRNEEVSLGSSQLPQCFREAFLSSTKPTVAVLATLNTKGKEARFVAEVLARAGATPWIVDLSLKTHDVDGADVTGGAVAAAAGTPWQALSESSRQDAAVAFHLIIDGLASQLFVSARERYRAAFLGSERAPEGPGPCHGPGQGEREQAPVHEAL